MGLTWLALQLLPFKQLLLMGKQRGRVLSQWPNLLWQRGRRSPDDDLVAAFNDVAATRGDNSSCWRRVCRSSGDYTLHHSPDQRGLWRILFDFDCRRTWPAHD